LEQSFNGFLLVVSRLWQHVRFAG